MIILPNNYTSSINLVDFPVVRLTLGQTVWIDNEAGSHPDADVAAIFEEKFLYIAPVNDCFKNSDFNQAAKKTASAERYGGMGVGHSGGGARCGNINGHQIKGIGKNPLASTASEKWHSYGGLYAKDAISETINSQVLEKILPVGTAKIFGVIFTTPDGAYKSYNDATGEFERDWGALLVREICVRPGHFMRAPFYKPEKNSSARIPPDVARVRSANRQFHSEFKNNQEFIKYLGKFLQNCANQFAFARVARIIHSGICPSNICFDGRWIDLTNASFIGGGENVGGRPPFYEEPFAIIDILREFTDTYSKYNNIELNITPLINYYVEQFTSYFSYHLTYLFGIKYEHIDESIKNNEYKLLVENTGLVICSGKKVTSQWPDCVKNSDPVIALIKGLFISLVNHQASLSYFSALTSIKGFNTQKTIETFKLVVDATYAYSSSERVSYDTHISVLVIVALKRSLFSEYFYKVRLDKQIEKVLKDNPIEGSRKLIDDSIAISGWIFSGESEDSVDIYKGVQMSIIFEKATGMYRCFGLESAGSDSYLSAPELISTVTEMDDQCFTMQNYNFKPHIIDILSILTFISTSKDSAASERK